jgi:3-methyl-2-oxobutanoate hydroxymethyltransferase
MATTTMMRGSVNIAMRASRLLPSLAGNQLARPNLAAAALPPSYTSVRRSSHSPLGHPPTNQRPKVTLNTLSTMYKKSEPITMLTAYDFPSAHVADHAGMDMVLVGDSLAMVSMGLEDTSEVTMDEMIMCCRSVARAVQTSFTVCSLFFFLYNCPC